MKPKKSKKANLETKRGLFFQIGLVIALGVVFGAMNYTNSVEQVIDLGPNLMQGELEVLAPIVRENQPKPPPPPTISFDQLLIVDNDVELDEELEILDTEIDEDEPIFASPVLEQPEEEVNDAPLPFYALQDKPVFPGGERGLLIYINKNVNYPVIAQENGVQETVTVTFIIDEKGDVTNVKILRGTDASLRKEALRVIKSLPRWKPGKQQGRPVKVSFQVPIRFQLK